MFFKDVNGLRYVLLTSHEHSEWHEINVQKGGGYSIGLWSGNKWTKQQVPQSQTKIGKQKVFVLEIRFLSIVDTKQVP